MSKGRSSSGTQVTALQRTLCFLGYEHELEPYYDSVDKFGPKTRGAVKAFQGDNGFEADGVVGPGTTAALTDAVRAQGASPSEVAATPCPSGPDGEFGEGGGMEGMGGNEEDADDDGLEWRIVFSDDCKSVMPGVTSYAKNNYFTTSTFHVLYNPNAANMPEHLSFIAKSILDAQAQHCGFLSKSLSGYTPKMRAAYDTLLQGITAYRNIHAPDFAEWYEGVEDMDP
jgi:hypothetical protein